MDGDPEPGSLEAKLAAIRARARAKLPARAAAIREAVGALDRGGSIDDVRRLAHKLRGIAETDALRAVAAELESLAKAGADAGALRAHFDALEAAIAAEQAAGGPAYAPTPEAPVLPPTKRRRALVVDDEPAILRLTALTLERLVQLDVACATTREEARRALRDAGPFDLVLLDAMMPNTTGLQLCAFAREVGGHGAVVILSAATPDQLGWSWADGEGPDAWWQKPLPAKEMKARVETLLEAWGEAAGQ